MPHVVVVSDVIEEVRREPHEAPLRRASLLFVVPSLLLDLLEAAGWLGSEERVPGTSKAPVERKGSWARHLLAFSPKQ